LLFPNLSNLKLSINLLTGHLLERAPANTSSLVAERQTQMERGESKRLGVDDQVLE
jgi:hypothetical protein